MRYTEIREPLDEQDKMEFYKDFQKALIAAFVVGGLGFILLFFDFIYYKKFQTIAWYTVVFIIPLCIFLFAREYFKYQIRGKDKHVIMGTVIDKKRVLETVIDPMGNFQSTCHLFIEGKDKPIKVSEELFHFLQKQDTMKLHYMDEVLYKYEKNV